MKICIVSAGDAFDKKNWSGTPYNIASRLAGYPDVEVVSLSTRKELPHPFYKLLQKTLGKIFLIKGSPRDPLLYGHDSAVLQDKMNAIGADFYLFCAEYCLSPQRTDAKYYSYVDATMRPLLEADPRKKIGMEFFLRGYEVNEKACYSLMDGVFTMNEWSRESIHQLYGYPKKNMYNIGFGVNVAYYEGKKDYSDPHLLTVLRKGTEYYKGLDLLLEAFRIVRKKRPDIKLSVVGTEYKNIGGVSYYYNQPREKTIELFRSASLYVMPAVREPNGITYLEALANRTPIVGLDRFAFPEFSGYGEFGFVVPDYDKNLLADTILKAISAPHQLERMGLRGQEFVKSKYAWDIVIEKMMNQFELDNAKSESKAGND